MTLSAGTHLGPYEIQAAIGAGGMGEVYKARDTRLDRTVAIKILPPDVSADPDRRARFQREARTIAGLSHPHICTLYDVGEHDGAMFLVMEHLHGETLAARLEKGRLLLDQALSVATEIADALTAAHKQGIIHRDLKPGNVMLTKTGTKLLDFGLARLAAHGERQAMVRGASLPTQAAPVTAEGSILGTLQYMAPEQLEGKVADARTDLWALGTILYEMVTGRRAFEGESQASLIGKIMNAEPAALATLQPLAPPPLDRAVRKCLAKDPDERWDSAHDAADELRWIRRTYDETQQVRRRWSRLIGFAAAVVVVAAIVGGAVLWRPQPAPAPLGPVVRLNLALPADVQFSTAVAPAWSPDGRRLIFGGLLGRVQQLYLRRLDQFEATALTGTAPIAERCFFSPDGRAVGFFSTDRVLRKLTLADGLVVPLVRDADFDAGGTWGRDGRITFSRGGVLWQLSADGGDGRPLTKLDAGKGEVSHAWPRAVGRGDIILFSSHTAGDRAAVNIEAVSATNGERRVLVEGGRFPLYTPSGHLMFVREGALLAAPFDVEHLRLAGVPVRVLEDVPVDYRGLPLLDVSAQGSLVYPSGGNQMNRLVWVSRSGLPESVTETRRRYMFPRLSPDGRNVVVTDAGDLWLHDTVRGTFQRLTADASAEHSWPVWMPDGKRIVFRTRTGLRWIDTNGGPSHAIPSTSAVDYPSSVSPDGGTLAFVRLTPEKSGEIYTLSLRGEPRPRALVSSDAFEGGAQFSPDGRWLAYVSSESGQMEVFVRSCPGPDRKWQVSSQGGTHPRWSRRGRELVYRSGDRMMVVELSGASELKLSQPRVLFEQRYAFGIGTTIPNYDVSADGQRFLMVKDETGSAGLDVVLNWFEELKAKVPTTR